MDKKYYENKLDQISRKQSEQEGKKREQDYGQGDWLEKAYSREFSRLQPIIDEIDASPNHIITVNGYTCLRDKFGNYQIGAFEDTIPGTNMKMHGGMITIEPGLNGSKKGIWYSIPHQMDLGTVQVSDDIESRTMNTIGYRAINPQRDGGNTILENAMKRHFKNPDSEKKRQICIQLQLIMLKKLGLELTPTEQRQELGYEKEYLENQLEQISRKQTEQEGKKREQDYGQGDWLEKAYSREFSRLQPIIDEIDASPNHIITVNGYTCLRDKFGNYQIGAFEDTIPGTNMKMHGGMITIEPGLNGSKKGIWYSIPHQMDLGTVQVSDDIESRTMNTIGYRAINPQRDGGNTILENAMKCHFKNPDSEKKREICIQLELEMLKSLNVQLTPEENMAMLRGKKQYLEEQLAEVDKELAQKESQQK